MDTLTSRRRFIKQSGIVLAGLALPLPLTKYPISKMEDNKQYDVIIVGGSYSGLAAGMALGRAMRHVLIIDSGMPCNRQTPRSHNFLTQDGKTPHEIATIAKQQVAQYSTVEFTRGSAVSGEKTENGFIIKTASGATHNTKKLIFATGVKDIMQNIPGYAACWGISVLHCPYCHGYEVRNDVTGILGNGDYGFEFSSLISNWTKDLTVFTNGIATLTPIQTEKLNKHNIKIVEKEVERFEHTDGHLHNIIFKDGSDFPIRVIYARSAFEQHCPIPQTMGCELTEEGYIKVNGLQKTSIHGVYACGDNTTRMRTVANAAAMGTTAGMMANKELVEEEF
ncbi:MAG: FAD-dependent pyridine nucleotide-disulfide oxidoreductase [Flavipsychrobacter sp.]|jgi:thioredoxin reductase|nr:FAD-dependent pyridine nucleotide-disulfide oxidoreductase [Flavipsychrobacter sp.]